MSDEADDAPAFELNGIQERDFQAWKHHPVTKVVMRYLLDYEQQVAERGVHVLRTAVQAPDQFRLGVFQGEINTLQRIAELKFSDLIEFYPAEEEEDNDEA